MTAKTSALIMGVGPEQGLGAALCKRFAREGIQIFVCGRTTDKVEHIAELINSNGGQGVPITANVTDEADVNAMIDRVRVSNLPLELAIYNAGNNRPDPFLEVTPEIFESMWRVLCLGGFLTSQAVLRLMLEQGDAAPRRSLLFTGASGSLRGRANFSAFAAGKGALRLMVQSLAREFGRQEIHVAHVIVDGAINGDKVVKGFPDYVAGLGKDGLLDIHAIAETFWTLHNQQKSAWTQEIDLRPFKENF
ncbi:MAG TPA: SDR family NAD(P)-dependent oxidoreductase [Gammaproteobacteria bacterium]|jgi:NAD(P)-dependent dehydrogenase (short-subunit alcohol dehydrogenase family)|nr:SDR family NAD(P)-dependent oxidoreductase [Gammaproteobacteria bacterium]|tara:strand:- start:687 stop:1433 length:747 start_codon:yes stop_codon:yes gene_type:complete